VRLRIIFVNNQLDAQFFFMYVYFYSLHVSGSHVPIIRRTICINTTSVICHSVQMTVWCAGLDETLWWLAHDCPKNVENRNKRTWKRIVRQVGYLQRLYRNAWSTEHKILKSIFWFKKILFFIGSNKAWITHTDSFKLWAPILAVSENTDFCRYPYYFMYSYNVTIFLELNFWDWRETCYLANIRSDLHFNVR
jgi:hypothetical protein